jgi:hypothetical protein
MANILFENQANRGAQSSQNGLGQGFGGFLQGNNGVVEGGLVTTSGAGATLAVVVPQLILKVNGATFDYPGATLAAADLLTLSPVSGTVAGSNGVATYALYATPQVVAAPVSTNGPAAVLAADALAADPFYLTGTVKNAIRVGSVAVSAASSASPLSPLTTFQKDVITGLAIPEGNLVLADAVNGSTRLKRYSRSILLAYFTLTIAAGAVSALTVNNAVRQVTQ